MSSRHFSSGVDHSGIDRLLFPSSASKNTKMLLRGERIPLIVLSTSGQVGRTTCPYIISDIIRKIRAKSNVET